MLGCQESSVVVPVASMRHRVDQRAFGAVRLDDQQHRVLLVGRAAHEEVPVTPPDRHADCASPDQLTHSGRRRCLPGQVSRSRSNSSSWALDHATVRGSSASSSQRYGSATG